MESNSDTPAIELGELVNNLEGIVLTQEERNALAQRIEKVILERKRIGAERRMRQRLNQLRSVEWVRERYHGLIEAL